MLPGFRFLFAATMLSMSLLIFGLGAAALLRAAHESFASNTSWHTAPEVPFAQRPDTTMPVLAALRVEPSSFDRANDHAAGTPVPGDQPTPDVETTPNEPAHNDQLAALRPADTTPLDPVKPAERQAPASTPDSSPATEAASVPAAATTTGGPAAVADEPKVTVSSLEGKPAKTEPGGSEPLNSGPVRSEPARSEAAAALTEPVAPPASQPQAEPAIAMPETALGPDPADSPAATKIATLGGPPVDITDGSAIRLQAVKLPRARPDTAAIEEQAAIRKRVQARRALHRRRLALRARLVLQQQQVNPFGQPQPLPQAAASPVAR